MLGNKIKYLFSYQKFNQEVIKESYKIIIDQKPRVYTKTLFSSLSSLGVYLKLGDPILATVLGIGAGFYLTKIPGTFEQLYYDKGSKNMMFVKYKKGQKMQREFGIEQVTALKLNTQSKIAYLTFKLPGDYNVFQINLEQPKNQNEVDEFISEIDSYILEKINKSQEAKEKQQKSKEEEEQILQQQNSNYKGKK